MTCASFCNVLNFVSNFNQHCHSFVNLFDVHMWCCLLHLFVSAALKQARKRKKERTNDNNNKRVQLTAMIARRQKTSLTACVVAQYSLGFPNHWINYPWIKKGNGKVCLRCCKIVKLEFNKCNKTKSQSWLCSILLNQIYRSAYILVGTRI